MAEVSANFQIIYERMGWILDSVALGHVKQLCARQESVEESPE
jgi:hypothetical protein